MREHNNGVSHHKKGKKPSGKEERGFMVGVLGWLGGGARVATSGHKEAHPSSSSSGCLGSDAAAVALKLLPSCPNCELSAEDEEMLNVQDCAIASNTASYILEL